MADTMEVEKGGDKPKTLEEALQEEEIDPEILNSSVDDITARTRALDREIQILRHEQNRLHHEQAGLKEKIKENNEKIKLNKQLPYLVANVVELIDAEPEEEEEGSTMELDAHPATGKCAVIKTSDRKTIFLPVVGLVDPAELRPADLIGVNKDSYLILDTLPPEYDARVKAMEVDERPTEDYSDVGGLHKQIEELIEAVVLPITHKDRFLSIGIQPPKGVLLYGPPGTGKTLMARACAAQTKSTFLKLAGPQLVQMFIGDGAKLVRDAFALAKEKAPAIIFIDELDAIGGKRNARDAAYMKQTLNQLLTELDGFEQNTGVIVLAATNHPQLLDKALTRPGRFDRHVVVDLPDVRGRLAILQHHAKKIKVSPDVKFSSIAGFTSGLSGAELENIVNQAAVHASKAKALSVSMKDLEWAMDKVIMGAERRWVISPKEKLMTAYHEAGHTLVHLFADKPPSELHKVTILARGQSLGHTAYIPEMDKYSYTLSDYMTHIRVALGGKIAEELAFGPESVTSGVSNDLEKATKEAFAIVGRFGMSSKLAPMDYANNYEKLSSETRSAVETEVQHLLNTSAEEVRTLLSARRKELDLLAHALVEYETLDKHEVERVIRGEKLTGRMPASPNTAMSVPVPATVPAAIPTGLGPSTGHPESEPGAGPPPPVPAP